MYLNYVKFNLNLLKIMWKEKLTISVKQIFDFIRKIYELDEFLRFLFSDEF